MRAKILVSLMFFTLLFPVASSAVTMDLAPEFNPLCWRKDECDKTRADILNKEVKDVKLDTTGWLKEEPCAQEGWGKCLPSGITVTEISFGGKNKFANLGDFLKTNYELALTVAGILAVIMIIVAGVQWVTSGGNSEMITSAKKRIGGALTGLLIAYLSYTILTTINPALVNLRLPQNFMIRPFKITPQYCRETSTGTLFALASKKGEAVNKEKMKDPSVKMEAMTPNSMTCGDNFFIEGGGGSTCMGTACSEKNKTCLPFTTNGSEIANNNPNCEEAQLAVHFTIDPLVKLSELFKIVVDVEDPVWMNKDYNVPFWAVCEAVDSKKLYIGDKWEKWDDNAEEGRKTFMVEKKPYNEYYMLINHLNPNGPSPAHPEDFWNCVEGDKLVGFVFKNEFFVNSNFIDANFSVSENYTGPWQSIEKNGYISIPSLENGVFINAKIDTNNLPSLIKDKWNNPAEMHWDGIGDSYHCVKPGCDDPIFFY